jgi:hypothetical protein
MRDGLFELRMFLKSNDEQLDERVINGSTYFVAVPNEEYYLKVYAYRDETGQFPMRYIRIAAYLDGTDVNYWKRLDMSNESLLPTDLNAPLSATFWGFKRSDDEIKSFRFANMNAAGSRTASSSGAGATVADAGHVKIDIFEAEVSEGMITNKSGCHEVPTQAGAHSASQKFWSQPSVTTVGGKNMRNVEKFAPITRWSNKPHPLTGNPDTPLVTMEAKYHTEMLLSTLEEIYAPDTGVAGGESGGSGGRSRASTAKPKFLGSVDLSQDSDTDGAEEDSSGAAAGVSLGLPAGGRGYVSVVREVRMVDISELPSESEEEEEEEGEPGRKRRRGGDGPIGVDSLVQERVQTYMEAIADDSDSDC